jgi:hypothetical protein
MDYARPSETPEVVTALPTALVRFEDLRSVHLKAIATPVKLSMGSLA